MSYGNELQSCIMKKLLNILAKLLRTKKIRYDAADDGMWEHLDGAEFFVVPAKPLPNVSPE